MSDEERDESGRLVSVVVDGQRFHRADDGELVESLERVTEARDAFKDERNRAVAEVRSLRGVVQAVREALDYDLTVCNTSWGTVEKSRIRAALAAAADAPQPAEPMTLSCVPTGCQCSCHRSGGLHGAHIVACCNPSPAVLPEPKDDQR